MNKINNISETLNKYFNQIAITQALETGFIQRVRKIKAPSFLKAMVLGNLEDAGSSVENICQILHQDDIEITKQGVEFRFTDKARSYMKTMFKEALAIFRNTLKIECGLLEKFKSIKLLDSTYITLPASMEDIYRGYATSYPNQKLSTKAGMKLQVVYDYLNQNISNVDIKEGARSDQGYRDYLESIEEGELHIADLGYFVPSSFRSIMSKKAYFISRYKSDTNIYDVHTEEKIEMLDYLKNNDKFEREVILGKEAKLKVRMVGIKLSKDQAEARKRKANSLAKSHGYTSSRKNQELLNWSIFITNIPSHTTSFSNIFKIYRLRWQIELLFKLYKSQVSIDKFKSKINQARILCEFYAKLIGITIFHGVANCVEVGAGKEFSLTKAMISFKKRVREMVDIISFNSMVMMKKFIGNLINTWSEICFKR